MRRFQLINTIGKEILTSLITYVGDSPARHVTDAVAADVLGVLTEGLMIDDPDGLRTLPDGCVIIDRNGNLLRSVYGEWWPREGYTAYERDFGLEKPGDIEFPVWLLLNPEWTDRSHQ